MRLKLRVVQSKTGFGGLVEIVSMKAINNTPSRRVMERLGMTQSIEFEHPGLPEKSPLRRHVLYRLLP